MNQVITAQIISIPSVVAYESGGAGTGWADQDATWTDVNIKLANQKGVPITIKGNSVPVGRIYRADMKAQKMVPASDWIVIE